MLKSSDIPTGSTSCLSHSTLGQAPKTPFRYFALIIWRPLDEIINLAWMSPYRSIDDWYTSKKLFFIRFIVTFGRITLLNQDSLQTRSFQELPYNKFLILNLLISRNHLFDSIKIERIPYIIFVYFCEKIVSFQVGKPGDPSSCWFTFVEIIFVIHLFKLIYLDCWTLTKYIEYFYILIK